MPGQASEVFSHRVSISGRCRLRDAAVHAARLFFAGEAPQLEFNLLGAIDQRAHDLIEPLGCNAGETPSVDLPHFADQILYIARDFVGNFAVASQHLFELAQVANSFTNGLTGIGWIEPAHEPTVRVKLAAATGSGFR